MNNFEKRKSKTIEEMDEKGRFFPKDIPTVLKDELLKGRETKIDIFDDSSGFFFHGPTGSGKSYQAACVMTEIAKMRNKIKGGYWVNVPKLLHDIKMRFGTNKSDLIEEYSKVPILCLDDLGSEQGSEWVMQTLYIIINSRYEEKLTTIITSNLSLDELGSKMKDDRLISRISAMCNIVNLNGRDKRRRRKK